MAQPSAELGNGGRTMSAQSTETVSLLEFLGDFISLCRLIGGLNEAYAS